MAYSPPIGSTAAWIQSNNSSVFTVQKAGSILAVSGSFTPAANQSVSGTVNVGNFPATQVVAPNNSSLYSLQLAGSILAVSGSFTPAANQSVSGTVLVKQDSTWIASVFGNMSVIGTVPVTQATTPWSVTAPAGSVMNTVSPAGSITAISGAVTAPAGSIMTTVRPAGSITAVSGATTTTAGSIISATAPAGSIMAVNPGTNPWPVVNVGSIISLSIGSIITVFQAPSIVGTYLEDAAHTTGDRGLFFLGVRNDTVASLAGANLDYTSHGLDSAGRTLVKPFASNEVSIISTASTVNFGSTTVASIRLFVAPGAGLKNYITDFNVSNTGGATTLVSFVDEDASVMGRTIAPAGGGSNHSFATPLTTQIANKQVGVIAATATSVLHITLTGYRAP